MWAIETDDGIHANKAVIGGGLCPGPPALLGLFGKASGLKAGDGGSLSSLDVSRGVFGVNELIKCHLTPKRTSADDPGGSACP
jgi:hypothetical protein